jgi:methyltransferase (TIGR00027 family)
MQVRIGQTPKGSITAMEDRQASQTALLVAYMRAAHQIIDTGPRVLDDPFALRLLGPNAEARIREMTAVHLSPEGKALRKHVLLRSRFAEDRLRLAVARGIRQYILIGAGFDTFALRQPDWARDIRIIEVDHPATQGVKKSHIAHAGIAIPANLSFVGIDFERETLEDGFARAGVDRANPAFFSWLGVSMYLTETAIDATLGCLGGFPKGGEAVVTFLQKPEENAAGYDNLADRVKSMGEPFISYFTQQEFENKLLNSGFSEVSVLTPEMSARYVDEHTSSLQNPKRTSIVSAIV